MRKYLKNYILHIDLLKNRETTKTRWEKSIRHENLFRYPSRTLVEQRMISKKNLDCFVKNKFSFIARNESEFFFRHTMQSKWKQKKKILNATTTATTSHFGLIDHDQCDGGCCHHYWFWLHYSRIDKNSNNNLILSNGKFVVVTNIFFG